MTLGGLFLVGLATDWVGRRTPMPRVSLLLLFGFAIGPSALDLLPDFGAAWFPVVANMALLMVGFLLGGTLTRAALRRHGRLVLRMSLAEALGTAAVVGGGLIALGVRLDVALLLAGIGTATDPAATADVVREAEARGRFTRTLLGIVAVDDAWGLLVFGLALAAVQALEGQGGSAGVLAATLWEVGMAVLVGVGLGVPMAFLTGRVRPGEPTLAEALGAVFLCGGIAVGLGASFLLSAMVLGAVVANLARHHKRPFHAIEGIEWPFMILFFVLAGASLRLEGVRHVGTLLAAYVVLRVGGRLLSGWLGGAGARAGPSLGPWIGVALMPQAGVAMGMALVASQRAPDLGALLLPVAIAATVLFEVAGPVLTRLALVRVGEAANARARRGPRG